MQEDYSRLKGWNILELKMPDLLHLIPLQKNKHQKVNILYQTIRNPRNQIFFCA